MSLEHSEKKLYPGKAIRVEMPLVERLKRQKAEALSHRAALDARVEELDRALQLFEEKPEWVPVIEKIAVLRGGGE